MASGGRALPGKFEDKCHVTFPWSKVQLLCTFEFVIGNASKGSLEHRDNLVIEMEYPALVLRD